MEVKVARASNKSSDASHERSPLSSFDADVQTDVDGGLLKTRDRMMQVLEEGLKGPEGTDRDWGPCCSAFC